MSRSLQCCSPLFHLYRLSTLFEQRGVFLIPEVESALHSMALTLIFITLTLSMRAIGRAIISRQLTFYKVYFETVRSLLSSWILSMSRESLSRRDRWIYILVLGGYTTGIAIFISSDPSALSTPVLFVVLFLMASSLRLLLTDSFSSSLRQFLLTPFFLVLTTSLLIGASISVGLNNLSLSHEISYIAFSSVALVLSFVLSLLVAFLFLFSQGDEKPGWGRLVQDLSELAFTAPLLFFYVNEGTPISWFSVVLWTVKTSVVLIGFDMAKKFIPKFAARHSEAVLLKLALPAVCFTFWALWISGAWQ
jgi:hypothetical protein